MSERRREENFDKRATNDNASAERRDSKITRSESVEAHGSSIQESRYKHPRLRMWFSASAKKNKQKCALLTVEQMTSQQVHVFVQVCRGKEVREIFEILKKESGNRGLKTNCSETLGTQDPKSN